jgi:hypothetical protein
MSKEYQMPTSSTSRGSKVETSASELKTLFEALNIAPQWMSKRFILEHYCGWSEQDIQRNASLRSEEEQQSKIGNKTGAYR